MESDLLSKRKAMKKRWKNQLSLITKHPQFQNHWNNHLDCSEYKITTMKKCHIDEILTMLCFSFSCLGPTNNHRILMTSPTDSYPRFKHELEHTLKTGLNIVILDKKSNKIIACWYGFDFKDQPSYKGIPITQKIWYIKQMHEYALDNSKYFQSKFNDNITENAKHGDIFYTYHGCVRPGTKGKGFFGRSGLSPILPGAVGFKYFYGDAVNPIMIKVFQRRASALPYYSVKIYDFRDFVFEDGTKMQKIIDDLGEKYGFDDKYVDFMRNNCRQALGVLDYSINKKRFDHGDNVIDGWVQDITQMNILMKNNRYRSKL